MTSLGPHIRHHILPRGLSVSDAARQLGVGRPALSNLLNGKALLSRSMALKLQEQFGADAEDLVRQQDALLEKARGDGKVDRAERQQAAGYLGITAADISRWGDTIAARTRLAIMVRRLVHADTDAGAHVDFPGGDAGERKGWDGMTEASTAGHWVPEGHAGWELSTSADLPGKPDNDLKARSKLPAAERAATTFIFVTTESWPGKDTWAAEQRRRGGWRDVRAYDASTLEQWLERSPTTQIWFASEIGRLAEGIVPLAECWRRWSESTSPALSPKLFDEMVRDRRQSIINWIDSDSERPFVIVAESAEEAQAFIACALRDPDGSAGACFDRAVLATDPLAVARLSAASRDAIILTADAETERAAGSLTRRNKIITVRPRTSVENDADLSVTAPSRETFRAALAEMKIPELERDRLEHETGLSPTILRRRLAVAKQLRLPAWASDQALIKTFMPMLLAGAWNLTVEGDRMLVELLAGASMATVEEHVDALLALPESPVWAIGNYRGLVSRKDALFTAGSALRQPDIDRFFEVAEFILSEDDPALDLEPSERWQASTYGKRRDVSGAMRAAVGEMLVLLGVYGDSLLASHIASVGPRVDQLVMRLLRGVESRAWISRQADLPLLAEASPTAFLDAVENDLKSNAPQILAMLRPVETAMFDSPDRTGLLWGLEAIAWNPDHLFRVARILARLSEVPIDDNWVNKPSNSLLSLVRSWLPQTSAPIDKRLALVDMLVRDFPRAAWDVCVAQIFTGHDSASPNHLPRWRTDAAGTGQVPDAEDLAMREHALDVLLAWKHPDRGQLEDVIGLSSYVPLEAQQAIWTKVETWIAEGASDEDRAALKEHMRRSILSRRSRKSGRADKLEARRRAVFDALTPRDPVVRYGWLFADEWISESGDEIWDDDFDFDRHELRIDALRSSAVSEVVASGGLDAIGRWFETSKAWGTVGRHLMRQTDHDKSGLLAQIIERATSEREGPWTGVLRGALLALDVGDRDRLIRSFARSLGDSAALIFFKAAPFEPATWVAMREERGELEPAYWNEVIPYSWGQSEEVLSFIVSRLLEADRPWTAFNAVSPQFKNIEGAMLARLMKAIIGPTRESETNIRLHPHNIDRALDALEEKGAATTAELAQLEYLFLEALTHRKHGIRNLEKHIEQSPGDYVQLVSLVYFRDDRNPDAETDAERSESFPRTAYRALRELKRTPGTRDDGSVDAARLLAWIVDVRERLRAVGRLDAGDYQIGELLGRSKPGRDGLWPCDAVRDAIEHGASDRMLRGMEIGLINSRGATWRGVGGDAERNLAAKYRAFAQHLMADYPVTAQLLESIARMWEGQAQWFDTDDAVRNRLRRP